MKWQFNGRIKSVSATLQSRNMILLTYVLFLCFSRTFMMVLQQQYAMKLESTKVSFVNKTLMLYESSAVRFNDTVNFLNLTISYKFDPRDSVVVDTMAFRVTKNNGKFRLFKLTKTLEETYTMDSFDVTTIYSQYCHPPLIWPPKKNVVYKSFGWAPNSEVFPPNLPSGKSLASVTMRFKHNNSKLLEDQWMFNVIYRH